MTATKTTDVYKAIYFHSQVLHLSFCDKCQDSWGGGKDGSFLRNELEEQTVEKETKKQRSAAGWISVNLCSPTRS